MSDGKEQCSRCSGTGIQIVTQQIDESEVEQYEGVCPHCDGSGNVDDLTRLRAENAAQNEELLRTWFVLKEFGFHPGRTDDKLADCTRAGFAALRAENAQRAQHEQSLHDALHEAVAEARMWQSGCATWRRKHDTLREQVERLEKALRDIVEYDWCAGDPSVGDPIRRLGECAVIASAALAQAQEGKT